jgi:hypothetical protein
MFDRIEKKKVDNDDNDDVSIDYGYENEMMT